MRHPKQPPRGAARPLPATDDEMSKRIEYVVKLVGECKDSAAIKTALIKKFKLSTNQVAIVMQRAFVFLDEDFERMRPHLRVLQSYRLHRHIENAVADNRTDVAIRGEQELSKILGTRAPKQIDLNPDAASRDAMLKVLGTFTRDDIERIAEEQLDLEERAKKAS